MNKLVWSCVVASSLVLGACGGGEVVVQASLEGADGNAAALRDLQVRALPYDRDAVFSELEQAHGVPQPEIPAGLQQLQDQISQAQQEWSNAESLWGSARDSLKVLSDRMRGMNRSQGQYTIAFREFSAQEAIEQRTKRQLDEAFRRFDDLQRQYNEQAEQVRLQREQWADEAYASVDSVIEARKLEGGLVEYADTTDGNGVARFSGMKKGQYWIYSRYELPYEELYWNVPIDVQGGEPVTVQLNRQTAQVRPKL